MAIAYGTVVKGQIAVGGPVTITLSSLNCSSGTDRVLEVGVVFPDTAASVVSVLFNVTEAATLLYAEEAGTAGNQRRLEVWRLKNPTATTADCIITIAATTLTAAMGVPMSGINQSTTDDGENFTNDAKTDCEITGGVTHGGGSDMLQLWCGWRDTNFTLTADAGVTQIAQHISSAASSSHVGIFLAKDSDSSTPKDLGTFSATARYTTIGYNLNASSTSVAKALANNGARIASLVNGGLA